MKFKLNVNITDDQYVEFNKFHLLRSSYGKKYMRNTRIVVNVCMAFICLSFLLIAVVTEAKSVYAGFAAGVITAVVYNFCLEKVLIGSVEKNIKKQLKDGLNLYTANQTIEFYDDKIVDYNEDERSEISFNKLEQVCSVDGKYLYLYVSAQSAHIIPLTAFNSHREYEEFLEFIESRGKKIEFYLPNSKTPIDRPKSTKLTEVASEAITVLADEEVEEPIEEAPTEQNEEAVTDTSVAEENNESDGKAAETTPEPEEAPEAEAGTDDQHIEDTSSIEDKAKSEEN